MLERPEKGDSEEAVTFRWKKAEGQEAWIKIGLAFLMFYFGEAVLFWQGGPTLAAPLVKFPLAVPLMYPLGYWGLFGASIFFILRKNSSSYNRSAMDKRFSRWQGGLLTLCITVGGVGVAFRGTPPPPPPPPSRSCIIRVRLSRMVADHRRPEPCSLLALGIT